MMMNKFKVLVAISTAVIIIALSILFALSPEKEKMEQKSRLFDNRISPLVDQGLIVEIKRIRHRGLLEKLLTPLSSEWKRKPLFYVKVTVDGLTFSSKNVTMLGRETEYLYNTWDTWDIGFKKFRMLKDVPEEQAKSKIIITLVERFLYGFLGKKAKDIERERIELTYDYRTGRWDGDDYPYDRDGYGHYVGKYFEVWFDLYQTDYDGDRIPYWTEVNVLHTDPCTDDSKLDPDRDGIPTAWEWKWGYDPFTWDDHEHLDPDVDGVENVEEYKMEKWLADPYTPDIYLEVDVMEREGLFDIKRELYEESKQALIERFCQHGINLYIDDGWPDTPKNGGGEKLPYIKASSQDTGTMLEFYDHHFPDERKGIFRYAVLGHAGSFCIPSKFNRYDSIHLGISRMTYLKYLAFSPRAKRVTLAKMLMHELGHSMGITPWNTGGCDNMSFMEGRKERERYLQTWANYKSVMNYYWLWGWSKMPFPHMMEYLKHNFLDYSDGSRGSYDQNDWEHLYLPTFEINANAIEEPGFKAHKILVENSSSPFLPGWEVMNSSLENIKDAVKEYLSQRLANSSIYSRGFEVKVYQKVNSLPGEKNIKVYIKPKVEPIYAIWSLAIEGYMDEEGSICFK